MEASPTTNRYGLRGSVVGSRMLLLQTDAVLCKLCARGSDDAFDVLHARYRQQVFAFVFHLLNRRDALDDAEDLTQDVFSKAFSAIRGKRSDGSFKHWLFTIARNATFDHIRARQPQSISLDDASQNCPEPSNVVSISSQVERRAELAWLVSTVSQLPERQREALVLRELGGMSHSEIAEELDTSVNATKQLIKRGRESVSESAEQNGYRSRNLGKDLALAAPVLPLAAAGLGVTSAGMSAAVGFGGLAFGTKIAAAALIVAAVGGSAVTVKQVESRGAGGSGQSAESVGSRSVTVQDGPTTDVAGYSLPGVVVRRTPAHDGSGNGSAHGASAGRDRRHDKSADARAQRKARAERVRRHEAPRNSGSAGGSAAGSANGATASGDNASADGQGSGGGANGKK